MKYNLNDPNFRWAVYNDGTQKFKDTVLKWINEHNIEEPINKLYNYYYYMNWVNNNPHHYGCVLVRPHNRNGRIVLSIDEFAEAMKAVEDSLEGWMPKSGEMIEVSDNKIKWEKGSYKEMESGLYSIGGYRLYKYARPFIPDSTTYIVDSLNAFKATPTNQEWIPTMGDVVEGSKDEKDWYTGILSFNGCDIDHWPYRVNVPGGASLLCKHIRKPQPVWIPKEGEEVEVSDDEKIWTPGRFVEMDIDQKYPYGISMNRGTRYYKYIRQIQPKEEWQPKFGELVDVSNDNIKWNRRIYCSKNPKLLSQHICMGVEHNQLFIWVYMKQVKEEQISITFSIGNEIVEKIPITKEEMNIIKEKYGRTND